MTLRLVLTAATLLVTVVPAAQAQTLQPGRPVSRADLTGALAWLNVNKAGLDEYDDWYNRGLYGGAGLGWYWTDNLKTEVDGGFSTRVEREVYNFELVGGRPTTSESTFHFTTRRVAISQQYQFYRNVWFHPFVTAGVDFTWEKTEQEDGPVTVFDNAARQTLVLREEVVHPTRTELLTRPFAAFGFKAYMTPRSFFRSDMKLVFRGGLDEVLMRFGFGVDF
jgi:hypothetical protein